MSLPILFDKRIGKNRPCLVKLQSSFRGHYGVQSCHKHQPHVSLYTGCISEIRNFQEISKGHGFSWNYYRQSKIVFINCYWVPLLSYNSTQPPLASITASIVALNHLQVSARCSLGMSATAATMAARSDSMVLSPHLLDSLSRTPHKQQSNGFKSSELRGHNSLDSRIFKWSKK